MERGRLLVRPWALTIIFVLTFLAGMGVQFALAQGFRFVTGKVATFSGVDTAGGCLSSVGFNDFAGLEKTFTLRASGSVVVMLQGKMSSGGSGDSVAWIRMTIDGVPQPVSYNEVRFTVHHQVEHEDLFGFNFLSAPLSAGAHTARIQARTQTIDFQPGGNVCMGPVSLVILHR